MGNLKTCLYRQFLWVWCIFLATNMSSCGCNNPTLNKDKQPTSRNTLDPSQKNITPNLDSNQQNPPPPPVSLSEAIKQFEEEAQAPSADPINKKIYELIRTLPPHRFYSQPDGRLTRISEEKNGHELFDKMLDSFASTEAIPDAITWLVDKKLLDLNETDSQGKTSLEKIVETWLYKGKGLFSSKFKQIADVAVKKGAKVSSEKAGSLLKKVLEKLLAENLDPKNYSDIIACLEIQKPKLDPLEATELWNKFIEKAINQPEDPLSTDFTSILDLLQRQGTSLSPEKATQLLQQATAKGKPTLYSRLIDLGADPDLEVSEYGITRPLLEYAYYKDNELFEKIVQNPKTTANTINKQDKDNFTLAMRLAYNRNLPAALLKNPLLDINTIKGNQPGTVDYTLLDIIVDNCINTERGGYESEKLQKIATAEKWLNFLKNSELVQHANFSVTPENIAKATAKLRRLTDASGSYIGEKQYYNASLEVAQKAVDFLNSKK